MFEARLGFDSPAIPTLDLGVAIAGQFAETVAGEYNRTVRLFMVAHAERDVLVPRTV